MAFKYSAFLLPLGVLAAKTGDSGELSSLDAGLGGTVEVVNDNELMISNYKLKDASSPALYWWGSETKDLSAGFRINNERVSKAASTDVITVKLDAGHTAADFSVVGLWCEKFDANFGQAMLSAEGNSSSTSTDKKADQKGAASGLASGKSAAVAALLSAVAFAAYLI
ncbi:hypothetical protein AUP68_05548 [Ilyonectria robusta]